MATSSRCGATRSKSAVGSAARRWFWFGLWRDGIADLGAWFLGLRGEFHADAAITDEAARAVEHGLAAHLEALLRAIGVEAAEYEVQERLAGRDAGLQPLAFRLVPSCALAGRRLGQRVHAHAEHLQDGP